MNPPFLLGVPCPPGMAVDEVGEVRVDRPVEVDLVVSFDFLPNMFM